MSESKALSTAPPVTAPQAPPAQSPAARRRASTGGERSRRRPSRGPARARSISRTVRARRRGRRARRRGRGRPCLSSAWRHGCRATMLRTLAAVMPWRLSDHRCSLSRCLSLLSTGTSGELSAAARQGKKRLRYRGLAPSAGDSLARRRPKRCEPTTCLLVSYRPLATRSLDARGALEAAPRGDTSSN